MKQIFRSLMTLFVFGLMIATPLIALQVINQVITNSPQGEAVSNHAPQIISDFRPVMPDMTLEQSFYRLEYSNQNLVLKNWFTQATTTIIQHYSLVASPPAYTLRHSAAYTYLIIRLD